ncbi:two-component system heavy metal sensor histidine kinase CusS [Chryseobacterium sp. H1D6B]|uniref:HAMP domain-containing sensor histidine kinase n=1 Tax=Chryseobacterium sp. H1D6B TaxID=2940588 RepID=UPI0015C8475B|nr:ATP-binding protein [Chryseobacterium sp. H1D6B]MDH6250831.1 two-component system heavy metal sensor histidine kinase CusS [Chryseobacterium sp. H1D6B]
MKVRTRLTLLFTLVTAMLMSFYGITVYFSSKEAREKSFYAELNNEAEAKANLFFQGELNAREMHELYKNNTQTLNEVQVAIYDPEFNLIYHDDAKVDFVKENRQMLSNIFKNKQISFYLNDFQVIGMVYPHDGKQYAVTAAAYDQYGYNSVNHLLTISIISFIIILALIYLAGLFLSKKALNPAVEMVDQIKKVTAGKLQLRLNYSEEKGEFYELEKSFNQMLERLDNSFNAQKHFVSNISHELNTPLAAMTAELELALQKEYPSEEYQKIIQNTLEDVQNMSRLSSSLMNLAKASYDPAEISFSEIRIDEILLDSYAKIRKENPRYSIQLNLDPSIEEQKLIHEGNSYLLLVAFNNLIDNACKYSPDNTCIINVTLVSDHLSIEFINKGSSVSAKEYQNIFKPFYRSENSLHEKGYGIGLYLTEKIISLHHAQIAVSSQENTTTFQIIW